MADSIPELSPRRAVLLHAALAGLVLGAVGYGGGSAVVLEASGARANAIGLLATAFISLLVGVWAGAPAAEQEELPLRERWMGAALAVAVAGAFATAWRLYGAFATGAVPRILALLVLVAVPVYVLGLLLPVLLAWGDRREDDEGVVEGWGGLGAVVPGVLAGAALGVMVAGLALPQSGAGVLLLGASVLLLIPVILPAPAPPEPRERPLHEAETPFGLLRVTEVAYPGERQPERRLYLNDEQESGELVRSGAPALAYIAAAESWLAADAPRGGGYLFLGGGAYTLPRRVAERDSHARITVVELDPEVTRTAYRFFGVRREHGIASVHGDARAFLEREDAEFDRIYLDVYGGTEALPYPLVTREAFAAVRRRLRAQGAAGLNLIGVTGGPEALRLWSVVRTLGEVFPTVALYTHLGPDYPDRQNVLLLGAIDPAHPFPPRAGLFDRWPEEDWPMPEGAIVFRDLFVRPPAAPRTGTG